MLEPGGELTQPLGRDIGDVLMAELCDERFTDRERFRLRPPPRALPLIVARVALGRAGEVVGGGVQLRVGGDVKAVVTGERLNLGGALGPVRLERRGHAHDAGERPVLAVLLHLEPEPAKTEREVVAVSRPRRHLPPVEGVLVQRAVLPVEVRPRHIHDRAVGVQLRVVRSARAVLKEGGDEVGGDDGELAARTV